MHFLVTRPREDAASIADALIARGHEVSLDPLLSIVTRPDVPVDLSNVQAVLATSANGLRAINSRSDASEWRALPLAAVGSTTAALAQEDGFASVHEAGGDVVSLAVLAAQQFDPATGSLLHIAGTVVAGDLKGALEKEGFSVERAVLYEAKAASDFTEETKAGFKSAKIDGVVLYSKRSAEVFVKLCLEAGLGPQLSGVSAYCLSANAAAPLAQCSFRGVHIATTPTETALLALLD